MISVRRIPVRPRALTAALAVAVLIFVAALALVRDSDSTAGRTDAATAVQPQKTASQITGDGQPEVLAPAQDLSPAPAPQAAGATVPVPENGLAVAGPASSPAAGSTFTVNLYENSGAVAVNAVQADLLYDSARLEYVGLGQGGEFDVAAASDGSKAGVVRLARGSTTQLTGTRQIAVLTFRARSAGAADLKFDTASSLLIGAAGPVNILKTTSGTTVQIGAGN